MLKNASCMAGLLAACYPRGTPSSLHRLKHAGDPIAKDYRVFFQPHTDKRSNHEHHTLGIDEESLADLMKVRHGAGMVRGSPEITPEIEEPNTTS
jgi:hypothetical protein